MECNHEFIYSPQLPKGYCRCSVCLQTFPLEMYVDQIDARTKKIESLLGKAMRDVDRVNESQNGVADTVMVKVNRLENEIKVFRERIEALLMEEVKEPVEVVIPEKKKGPKKKKT